MSQFLYRRLREQRWLEPDPSADAKLVPGLVVRVDGETLQPGANRYVVEPSSLPYAVVEFATKMDLAAVVTISSDITSYMFAQMNHSNSEILLSPHNITVPVINSLADLRSPDLEVTRRDYCCLVRRERVVLAWASQADQLLLHAADVETKLMGSVSKFIIAMSIE